MNIDEIVAILDQTLCAPKGAVGLVFALWIHSGWTQTYNSPPRPVWAALTWAAVVIVVRAALWANRRFVSGPPHKYSSINGDYVVITGGGSGLGLILAALYSAGGFTVEVLDREVQMPITLANVTSHQLDVGDRDQVFKIAEKITQKHYRGPAVVINCAGLARGGALADQSASDVEAVVNTNILGNVWIAQAFAPHMLEKGGHLVGISSATALASPGGCAIYAASKAAVRSMYASLRQEQSSKKLRVLCVVPGQLDTRMFSSVSTPDAFWAPVMPAHELAAAIYNAVMVQGKQGELLTPFYVRLLPIVMNLVPQSIVDLLRTWNGIDRAMDTFIAAS